MAKKQGSELFREEGGRRVDADLHAAILGDDDKHVWFLNDPRQVAAKQAEVALRVKADRRKS